MTRELDDSQGRYNRGFRPHNDRFAGNYSPILNYRYDDVRETLELMDRAGDASLRRRGRHARLRQPAHRRADAADHRRARAADSPGRAHPRGARHGQPLYHVLDGRGIEHHRRRSAWTGQKGDTFCAPTWAWREHTVAAQATRPACCSRSTTRRSRSRSRCTAARCCSRASGRQARSLACARETLVSRALIATAADAASSLAAMRRAGAQRWSDGDARLGGAEWPAHAASAAPGGRACARAPGPHRGRRSPRRMLACMRVTRSAIGRVVGGPRCSSCVDAQRRERSPQRAVVRRVGHRLVEADGQRGERLGSSDRRARLLDQVAAARQSARRWRARPPARR